MNEGSKMPKKLLSLLIAVAGMAVFGGAPAMVRAEAITYELWVNGEQFTSEKTTVTCGSGTATFDAETNTLTLNEATIDKVYESQYASINSGLSNLIIKLLGDNFIDGQNNNDGIDAAGGANVTITGTGTLTMNNMYYGTYIGNYETAGGDLTIKDTTVNVTSANCAGIWVNHNINFINSDVQINKANDNYNGIVSNIGGTITVDGGNVTVNTAKAAIHMGNTDDSNHSLVVNSGTLKITSRDNLGIKVEPVVGTSDVNGTLIINGGVLDITSAIGGTNIPLDKITVSDAYGAFNVSSLLASGHTEVAPVNTYMVTFRDDDETLSIAIVKDGNIITPPADPTKDGYEFWGWYGEDEDGHYVSIYDEITANTVFTAQWLRKYPVVAGASETHYLESGSDVTIKIDGPYDDFLGFEIYDRTNDDYLTDSEELTWGSDYTVASGSTIVTLKNSFLKTLSPGVYDLDFYYEHEGDEGAFAYAQLTIKEGSAPAPETDSNTNNSSGDSPAGTSDPNDRHASGDNVPNEARPQGCAESAPSGQVDLFQINRKGTEATLYFAPVPGAKTYHVVFGHNEGDERYGGVSLSADDISGVLAIDVANLTPSQQYAFKIAPVNGCAVGEWSNWLTVKAVSAYGKTPAKTYRYH